MTDPCCLETSATTRGSGHDPWASERMVEALADELVAGLDSRDETAVTDLSGLLATVPGTGGER